MMAAALLVLIGTVVWCLYRVLGFVASMFVGDDDEQP